MSEVPPPHSFQKTGFSSQSAQKTRTIIAITRTSCKAPKPWRPKSAFQSPTNAMLDRPLKCPNFPLGTFGAILLGSPNWHFSHFKMHFWAFEGFRVGGHAVVQDKYKSDLLTSRLVSLTIVILFFYRVRKRGLWKRGSCQKSPFF